MILLTTDSVSFEARTRGGWGEEGHGNYVPEPWKNFFSLDGDEYFFRIG
jgi:hypothetical protein